MAFEEITGSEKVGLENFKKSEVDKSTKLWKIYQQTDTPHKHALLS